MKKRSFIIILFLVSIIVGVINLTSILSIKKTVEGNGDVFLPIQSETTFSDELILYATYSKKIYKNFSPVNDFYFEKYQNENFPAPMLSHYFHAPLFFVSEDVTDVFLLGSFIFSVIFFFLFYFLGKILFKDDLWSIFFASLASLAIMLVKGFVFSLVYNSFTVLSLFIPFLNNNYINDRMFAFPDPSLTLPFYLGAVISIILFIQETSSKKAVVTGFLAGFLFYIYTFYAAFICTIVCLYSLFCFIKKDKQKIKHCLILLATVFIVSIPYIWGIYSFFQFEHAQEISQRIGMDHGRFFRTLVWKQYLTYIIFFIVNYFVFKKEYYKKYIFYNISFLAMVICHNVQLILGFVPHPDHWYRTFSPILFFNAFDILYHVVAREKRIKLIFRFVVGLLILLLFCSRIVHIIFPPDSLEKVVKNYSFDKEVYSSYEWIGDNEYKLISPAYLTSYYTLVYTSSVPYLATTFGSLASNWELEQRLIEVLKLFNVENTRVSDMLNDKETLIHLSASYYKDQSFNFSLTTRDFSMDKDKKNSIMDRYEKLDIDWSDYDGYYVYFGPFEKEIIRDYEFDNDVFDLVYENKKVNIYKINSGG